MSRRREPSGRARTLGVVGVATLLLSLCAAVSAGPAAAAVGVSFDPPVDYATGTTPVSVAIGDLNQDGIPDLVVANATSATTTGTVSVLLGTADGTYAPKVDYGTGVQPHSVAVADLNKDGFPDLAVANLTAGTASVLLNNGDGTFAPKVDYPALPGAFSVAIGDLNSDGIGDLAVTSAGRGEVVVLVGQGNGGFLTHASYGAGAGTYSAAIEDLNGDGHPDLVAANVASSTISVLLSNGTSILQPKVDYTTDTGPTSVAIGDLNGDGHPDLAAATHGAVSVLLGAGDGTFAPRADYGAGDTPDAVAIGDLNGDGHLDLAVANQYSGTVSVLLGNGDGTFAPNVDFATGSYPSSVAIGDLNGDGHPDLAVTNAGSDTVSVLLSPSAPACTGGLTLSSDAGDQTGTPGQDGTWTFTVTARNCTGAHLTDLELLGGTSGALTVTGVTADPSALITTVSQKKNGATVSGDLASLGDQATATMTVTVSGTVAKHASCGSQLPISSKWSASATGADGKAVKSPRADAATITVTCSGA